MNRMSTFSIFFLLFALCLSSGECEVLYKRAGDEVSMSCGGSANTNLEWRHGSTLIFNVAGKTGTKRRGSARVISRANTYGNSLKISKLETRDSGVYTCTQSGKEYMHTVHVVSVSVKPGTVLFQSSDAELHCLIGEDSKTKVKWLRPNGGHLDQMDQIIKLKSVTSNEQGQWTCQINDLKIHVTLTVVDLQTKDVEVPKGGNIELPCSLPQATSQQIKGGKWKRYQHSTIPFPILEYTDTNGLRWKGENSTKLTYTRGQLSTNFSIKLTNVQPNDAGTYACTVEFDGQRTLTANVTLIVHTDGSGGQVDKTGNGKKTSIKESLKKNVFGVQLWVWIAVGAGSVFLLGLIILIVLVQRRNKRMKKKVRTLRSMRQPLTAKDYCQCNRSETEVELGKRVRPAPIPRQQRQTHNR